MRQKILLTFALLLILAQGAWAQTAVDLGLPSGTKWADRNVGAASATAACTFFEWGEITAYDNNYTYSDNPTTLPLSNDAARQTWGGQWRMPTKADFEELLNSEYTTWAWTENYNGSGVKGYIISGKGAYSGNSIFMPLTGFYHNSLTLVGTYRGDYWSSTRSESNNNRAYWIGFGSGDKKLQDPYDRVYGFAVRPVQMFVGAGTSANPYKISTTTDWNNLVTAVNGGESFSGKFFKMTANVGTVTTWMTGTFSGTFDGNGKTLTVNYSGSGAYCAPFGTLSGATVKNLKVAGTISTSETRPASIAGYAANSTITNCSSSVAITASKNGSIDGGGLVGCVDNSKTLTMSGCAFTGSITYSNAAGKGCGGMVGWMRSGSTATLTNCVFAPSSVSIAKASDAEFNMFVRGAGSHILTNCYYNGTAARNAKITMQDDGMQARTIAKGDYVSSLTVNKGAATTTYTVSGITVYSGKGIDFNGTFYGGSGQSVGLTLGHDTRDGYQFREYTASQGTLASETTNTPTLTMPAANSTANDVVTISAEFDPLYNTTFATGNDNSGWTITPTQQIEGGTVTVSYSGDHKVKSVTVTNKYAIAHSLAAAVVGDIVGSDGNAYSVAEKNKLPVGVTAEAVVCYKSGSNGLAVALVNLSGTFDHEEAVDYTGSNYTGFCTAHPVSGQTWKVLSQDEFSNVYNGCGGTAPTAIYPADGYNGNRGSLDTYITNAGGTAMSGNYWTATTYTRNYFVCTNILSGNVCNFNYNNTTYKLINVRYGFAF